jgi:hypothetical protein
VVKLKKSFMAQFIVPKFIEREPKIVGPFTWKQFIFVGLAGAVGFILYFSVPFLYFLFITIILMIGALALAFLKIGGRSVPLTLKNFFSFFVSPKIYIWGRKHLPKITKEEKLKPGEARKAPTLKIAEKSQLKNLSTKVETMLK